jgi:hypothetical protein
MTKAAEPVELVIDEGSPTATAARPEDSLISEVHAAFGYALHEAQEVENGIVNVVIWTGVGDGSYMEFEQSEAANATLFRQTMGAVKTRLMQRLPPYLVEELDDLLIRAVRLRNFLAHDYFRQRAVALLFLDSREQMIAELEDAAGFFRHVRMTLHVLAGEFLLAMRVPGLDLAIPERSWKQGFGAPLPGIGG